MVGHGGSSAGSYLADPTSPIPSHCASIVVTSTVKVKLYCFLLQRLSNGSIDPDSDVNRVIELQETLEKQNNELTAARTKIAELTSRIKELEDSVTSSSKELGKSQEQCIKLQRDLREVSESTVVEEETLWFSS